MEKIIHQMWLQGHEHMPVKYQLSIDSWKTQNPGYEHIFWDKSRIECFMERHYPRYLHPWQTLDKPIKQCDAARYFILHHYGGVYADMDTIAHKSMDALILDFDLFNFDLIFSEESHEPLCWKNNLRKLLSAEQEYNTIVGNAILISKSKQKFWLDFIEQCFKVKNSSVLESFSTWHLTGFINHQKPPNFCILPCRHLLAMHYQENISYTTHSYDATWFDHTKPRPWEG